MRRKNLAKIAAALAGAMVLAAMPMTTFNAQEVSACQCPCYHGSELLKNGDFSNKNIAPWSLSVTKPASAQGELKDGSYKVTIDTAQYKDKNSRWAVSLNQEDLTLKAKHTYNISFTVMADHDCMIYPQVGDEGVPFNEYWNGVGTIGDSRTWMPVELKAGEAKTINGSFKMDKTVGDCSVKFDLAGDCAPKDLAEGETYSYTFSNVSLLDRGIVIK